MVKTRVFATWFLCHLPNSPSAGSLQGAISLKPRGPIKLFFRTEDSNSERRFPRKDMKPERMREHPSANRPGGWEMKQYYRFESTQTSAF